MTTIGIILLIVLYFAPAISAMSMRHKNASAISLLNLFLGWTFVGWVVAAIWTVKK